MWSLVRPTTYCQLSIDDCHRPEETDSTYDAGRQTRKDRLVDCLPPGSIKGGAWSHERRRERDGHGGRLVDEGEAAADRYPLSSDGEKCQDIKLPQTIWLFAGTTGVKGWVKGLLTEERGAYPRYLSMC